MRLAFRLEQRAGHRGGISARYDPEERRGTVLDYGDVDRRSTAPSGLTFVVAIAAGATLGLALKGDGTVVQWGGSGSSHALVPKGLSHVVAIASGFFQDLAIFDAKPANQPPIPAKYAFAAWRDRPNVLDVADLLRVSSDPDGDALSLTAVSATSTAGGTVVLSTNAITYTPPAGFIGSDSFTYTLTDARQATALGTVTVKVIAPDGNKPSIFGITTDINSVTARLLGAPGQSYQFEASTNLVNWVNAGQATAAPNGLFEFTDRDKGLYPFRYYRATE